MKLLFLFAIILPHLLFGVSEDSTLKYVVGVNAYFGRTINNNSSQDWMNQNNENQVSKSYGGAEIFGAFFIKHYLLGLTFGQTIKGFDEIKNGYPLAITFGKMTFHKNLHKVFYNLDFGLENEVIKVNTAVSQFNSQT